MKVHLFGNEDHPQDSVAFNIVDKLINSKDITDKEIYEKIEFVMVKPNEDLPFSDGEDVVLLDAVMGIPEVTLLEEDAIEKVKLSPMVSVHDFDLGFQLKYLKKLGKIGKVRIIGIPFDGHIDLIKLHNIFIQLTTQI